METRVSSKRCFMNFTKKLGTKCWVIRNKNAKGCFSCNDKIIIEARRGWYCPSESVVDKLGQSVCPFCMQFERSRKV